MPGQEEANSYCSGLSLGHTCYLSRRLQCRLGLLGTGQPVSDAKPQIPLKSRHPVMKKQGSHVSKGQGVVSTEEQDLAINYTSERNEI